MLRVIFTFALKALLHWRALSRCLHLVATTGGQIQNIGLDMVRSDEDVRLKLVIWVQLPSLLDVEWDEDRGWVLETHAPVGAEPDEETICEQVRYLLSGVPRGRVVFNDPVLKDAVDKVYSSAQEV